MCCCSMQSVDAKAAKEAFIAGHSGTSLSEINAIVNLAPVWTLLYCSLRCGAAVAASLHCLSLATLTLAI